jgi:hypothetical protein
MSNHKTSYPADEQMAGAIDSLSLYGVDRGNGRTANQQVLLLDREVTELALLLPTVQAARLERIAQQRHVTMGQLLRRLVRAFLANEDASGDVRS